MNLTSPTKDDNLRKIHVVKTEARSTWKLFREKPKLNPRMAEQPSKQQCGEQKYIESQYANIAPICRYGQLVWILRSLHQNRLRKHPGLQWSLSERGKWLCDCIKSAHVLESSHERVKRGMEMRKNVFDLYVENLDECVIKEMETIVRDVNP